MKKIVITVTALAFITIAVLALMHVNAAPKNITLEWREVTATDAPVLESLRGIFIDAFLPISKMYYAPKLADLPVERR